MTFSMGQSLAPFRPPDPDGNTNTLSVTDLFLGHIDPGTLFPLTPEKRRRCKN